MQRHQASPGRRFSSNKITQSIRAPANTVSPKNTTTVHHSQPSIPSTMQASYLDSVRKQFAYYKLLGEQAIDQLRDDDLFWRPNEESNSIATIVKHLSGNMISRWTDVLTTDGEKAWRNRDSEFEDDTRTREALMQHWNKGWQVCLDALYSLGEEDLGKTIYIRNQGHTVVDAINRQLAHYPYHVGQIIFIGKMRAAHWTSLSIPKGQSVAYNAEKFSRPQHNEHFTDEVLKKGG
jgi:hypothetical protein